MWTKVVDQRLTFPSSEPCSSVLDLSLIYFHLQVTTTIISGKPQCVVKVCCRVGPRRLLKSENEIHHSTGQKYKDGRGGKTTWNCAPYG